MYKLGALFTSVSRIILLTALYTILFSCLISISFQVRNHIISLKYNEPFNTTQYRALNTELIMPYLLNTLWIHIEPCGAHFDQISNFTQAKSCVNNALIEAGDSQQIEDSVRMPTCYVITTRSPDVVRDKLVNVAVLQEKTVFGIRVFAHILGFFDPATEKIFLVENIDIESVYRHELQHYFLHLVGIEGRFGPGHVHHTYDVCEPRTYDKSEKVKELEEILNI